MLVLRALVQLLRGTETRYSTVKISQSINTADDRFNQLVGVPPLYSSLTKQLS